MKKWLAKLSHYLSPRPPRPEGCFINYKTAMSPTHRSLSGIDKLSASERQFLSQWTAEYFTALQQIKWAEGVHKAKQTSPWDLAMVAIIYNEAAFLKEWIEYHLLLGVQHFIIYNNFSTDHYLRVLEPYLELGTVALVEWPVKGHPAPGQLEAYADAIRRLRGKARWVAFCDIDEFFVPKHCDDLVTFLKDYEDYAEVVINWQLFGTSNIHVLPENALLTESMTDKFPQNFHHSWNTNHCVKAIVKPEFVEDQVNTTTHFFTLKKGHVAVDPNKQPREGWLNPDVPVDRIQINHYWFRTIDHFYRKREIHTYSPALIQSLFALGSSEKDTCILRFLPKLRQRMADHNV